MFGIETEYGVSIDGVDEIDPVKESIEIVKSYRQNDVADVRWDYSMEDPLRDVRGFRAKQLLEDPDEKKHQRRDSKRNLSFEEIKSDLILINGARLYNDHAHPEYSTPECTGLFELVAHDKAGERILEACTKRRSENLDGKRVSLYKNNTDFHGHSYGCHDNYFMLRKVPFDYLKERLIPFFVTRQIFAGAGKVGTESECKSEPGPFQIAQRSDFFMVETSVDTMYKRPIINTRDEPHADPTRFRRLHGIVGDANMSEYSTALKIGTTVLVLDLIEEELMQNPPSLRRPTKAIKDISKDQSLKWIVELEDKKTISAVDVQREYLSLAERHLKGRDPEYDWVLREWEFALNTLESDPMNLKDRLDWPAKKWLLQTFIQEEGLSWEDPWVQSLDLEYHNIDRQRGLYYELLREGIIKKLVWDEDVENSVHSPPSNTRAYFRGKSLGKFRDDIKSIQWNSVLFSNDGMEISVSMNDLIDSCSVKAYNRAVDDSTTSAELLHAIRRLKNE